MNRMGQHEVSPPIDDGIGELLAPIIVIRRIMFRRSHTDDGISCQN